VDEGPDGGPWYGITSDRHGQIYHVPAEHLRLIPEEELAPISPNVPATEKRIEISIDQQVLTAFEGDEVVLKTKVATGLEQQGTPFNGIPTDTPLGGFRISRKMPVRHMGNGDLVSNLTNYELPGVPWVSYFVATGVALHGAYWHDNYGRRMSHGCVNMTPDDAKWIYRWTTPAGGSADWYVEGSGTVVRVF
jgi:lipoprotein-anchoring transpeptidase ErfK/SrfK